MRAAVAPFITSLDFYEFIAVPRPSYAWTEELGTQTVEEAIDCFKRFPREAVMKTLTWDFALYGVKRALVPFLVPCVLSSEEAVHRFRGLEHIKLQGNLVRGPVWRRAWQGAGSWWH